MATTTPAPREMPITAPSERPWFLFWRGRTSVTRILGARIRRPGEERGTIFKISKERRPSKLAAIAVPSWLWKDHGRRIRSRWLFAGMALMGEWDGRRFRRAHIPLPDEPHHNRRVGDRRILGEMERWRSCDPSATVALDGDSAGVESCCGWFRACMSTGCASPDGSGGMAIPAGRRQVEDVTND